MPPPAGHLPAAPPFPHRAPDDARNISPTPRTVCGFKVISFDYRMPPGFPYPAAMDDAMAVWREAIKMQNPRNMAIFGTSTGGGMALASGRSRLPRCRRGE